MAFLLLWFLKELWLFIIKESKLSVEQKYKPEWKRNGFENGKSHTQFWDERWTLCFSSYKNCELKVKLLWVRACETKKEYIL